MNLFMAERESRMWSYLPPAGLCSRLCELTKDPYFSFKGACERGGQLTSCFRCEDNTPPFRRTKGCSSADQNNSERSNSTAK